MSLSKNFRRIAFVVAYNFYLRRKLSTTSSTKTFGFELNIPPTVFHPKYFFSSSFFGRYIRSINLQGKSVLDMGSGSGILSLIAASKGALVSSVDINPRSVIATRENAIQNHLEQCITAFQGNLFKPIPPESRFDLILFNPPFYHGEPVDIADSAWKGGKGHRVIKEFIEASHGYLNPDSRILMVISSDMETQKILDMFSSNQFATRCVSSMQTLFDRLFIYEATISS